MDRPAGKTLLIVDDDPRIRGLLTESLDALGYHTVEAANGREALSITRETPPDCVITDIKMPELDGLSLLHHLKSEQPNLPVVMITGYAFQQLKMEATDAGADAFLMKPFRLAKIEEVLGRILTEGDAAASAPRRVIRHVLIVEDDPEFAVLLTEVIEAMGYSAASVGDAESALQRIAHHCPDVLIADYKLPGMTGEELIHQIKMSHPDMPVVLITGYLPSFPGREYADAFLMKPFRIDRIGDVLKSLEEPPISAS
ncbi:MAG: response regulator [candidate division Zixibacteria bacterium]|nr:response regulator [candidate division Zixibacteria bacterium]